VPVEEKAYKNRCSWQGIYFALLNNSTQKLVFMSSVGFNYTQPPTETSWYYLIMGLGGLIISFLVRMWMTGAYLLPTHSPRKKSESEATSPGSSHQGGEYQPPSTPYVEDRASTTGNGYIQI
jgi:hypothetical protein